MSDAIIRLGIALLYAHELVNQSKTRLRQDRVRFASELKTCREADMEGPPGTLLPLKMTMASSETQLWTLLSRIKDAQHKLPDAI